MENLTIPMFVVFIGAILSGLGAFWATYSQNQAQLKSANERAQFEKELREKSDEITKLNRKIAESITGGDSYCFVAFKQVNNEPLRPVVLHMGEHNLYDVTIRKVEIDQYNKIESENSYVPVDYLISDENIFKVGELPPHSGRVILGLVLPDSDYASYNFYISARNGSIVENLRMRKINGEWKSAIRLSRKIYSKEKEKFITEVIKDIIDPDYPRKENGDVNW